MKSSLNLASVTASVACNNAIELHLFGISILNIQPDHQISTYWMKSFHRLRDFHSAHLDPHASQKAAESSSVLFDLSAGCFHLLLGCLHLEQVNYRQGININ